MNLNKTKINRHFFISEMADELMKYVETPNDAIRLAVRRDMISTIQHLIFKSQVVPVTWKTIITETGVYLDKVHEVGWSDETE